MEPCLVSLATLANAFGMTLSELLKGFRRKTDRQDSIWRVAEGPVGLEQVGSRLFN
jgi:hypothetical protein